MAELAHERRDIEALNAKLASGSLDSLASAAKTVGNIRLIAADMGDMGMDAARSLCDAIKEKYHDAAAVIAIHSGDKLNFVAACCKAAVASGAHAGNLL